VQISLFEVQISLFRATCIWNTSPAHIIFQHPNKGTLLNILLFALRLFGI